VRVLEPVEQDEAVQAVDEILAEMFSAALRGTT
jgi:hypothetical protein